MSKSWLAGIVLSLIFTTSAWAQPAAPSIAEQINGGWKIAYEDAELGRVNGSAYVDLVISYIEIVLVHPISGAETRMEAEEVRLEGTTLHATLGPDSPTLEGKFVPLSHAVEMMDQSTLALGEAEAQIPVGTLDAPDGRVELRLEFDPQRTVLAGWWVQRVDAETGQPDEQKGRQGHFRLGDRDQGGAEMYGRELWSRPPPTIKAAFVIEDQMDWALGGPAYTYPKPGSTSGTKRTIMIYGQNLPRRAGEHPEVISADPAVDYYVYRYMNYYEQNRPVDTYWRDKGFKKIDQLMELENPPFKREAGDEFLILEARFRNGVTPGSKAVSLNGTDATWLLRFGDHTAKIGFARDDTQDLRDRTDIDQNGLEIDTEFTEFLYGPEQIYLEVHAKVDLPVDSLKAMVAKNGAMLKFNNKREITLQRSSNPDEPRVYRSAPIQLIKAGEESNFPSSAMTIVVQQQDKLQLSLAGPPILGLDQPAVTAMVLNNPSDVRSAIRGDWSQKSLLWREAVYKSAECAGIEDVMQIGDPNALSREQADSFTDYIPTTLWNADTPSSLTTNIKVGEHAGMIMLRQMLIDMMSETVKLYEGNLNDKQILALRKQLAPTIRDNDIPLERIRVSAPGGGEIDLETSFYDSVLKDNYNLEDEAAEAFQIRAMREARSKFATAIRESLQRAKDTDPCDVYDMTKLVGFGMEAVRERANGALMKLKEIRETYPGSNGTPVNVQRLAWVPDRQARARLGNVALVAETLQRQEDLSDGEWDTYFLTVSLITLPLGFTGVEVILAAVLVIDVTDFGINLYQELGQQYREEKEMQFALGASAVIGTRRYDVAVEKNKPWYISGFKILLSGVQVGGSTWDFAKAGLFPRSVARGQEIIKGLKEQADRGLEAIKRLTRKQREDVMNAMIHARRMQDDVGRAAMETQELEALEFSELIESGEFAVNAAQAATRPSWAADLSESAFRRLDDMLGAPHVARLTQENPRGMSDLLMDDDALDILRLPHADFAAFQRAVNRFKNRAPTRGADFVAQADVAKGNPEGIFFSEIRTLTEGSTTTAVMRAYPGQDASGPVMGFFSRQRAPDDVLGTGKDLFVFDVAQTFRQYQRSHKLGRAAEPARRTPAPGWINDVAVPLRGNAPGVPFVMFSNMRLFQKLGFSFGDPALGGLKLSNVQSANTAAELHWLRHAYPDKSVDELFRYTLSYRYAQNTLEQLGFRITEVQAKGAGAAGEATRATAQIDDLVKGMWFDPGNVSSAADVVRAREAFVQTYRVADNPDIPIAFDVYLKVERL